MGENRFSVAYRPPTRRCTCRTWSGPRSTSRAVQNLYFNISHLLASDVVGDYDRSLEAMDYPGFFVDATAYTLDNGYFPRQGFSAQLTL